MFWAIITSNFLMYFLFVVLDYWRHEALRTGGFLELIWLQVLAAVAAVLIASLHYVYRHSFSKTEHEAIMLSYLFYGYPAATLLMVMYLLPAFAI